MNFETTIEVNAPLDLVWSRMIDVRRWPEITASVRQVTILGDGPLAVSTRVRIKQPGMPMLTWEVTEIEPKASFTWQSRSPGVTTVGTHTVAETAHGVSVTLGVRQSGPISAVVGLLMGNKTKRYVQMEATGLKQRSESAA
jgi:uncharacterized membrane protein